MSRYHLIFFLALVTSVFGYYHPLQQIRHSSRVVSSGLSKNEAAYSARFGARVGLAAASATLDADVPEWVNTINTALDSTPFGCMAAFVLIDLGSACCLLALIAASKLAVPSDFALAYAICKGVLRVPRIALDASGAALLARLWPALTKVNISRMVDAGARAVHSQRHSGNSSSSENSGSSSGDSSSDSGGGSRRRKAMNSVAARVKQLTNKYGLAYMAAKNFIGPMTILFVYAALTRASGGAHGGIMAKLSSRVAQSAGARSLELFASQVALASTASTLLFPGVVMGAAFLGPMLERARSRTNAILLGLRAKEL